MNQQTNLDQRIIDNAWNIKNKALYVVLIIKLYNSVFNLVF